jgi:glyoxylase-like metal-dependent hydrolase (beta-lactamase superfamily II)
MYMLYSTAGPFSAANMAALVGDDGLVLVDGQSQSHTDRTLAALRRLSDKPVRYVINTHCHADHTGNNAIFQRDGATVIAHANTVQRLQQRSCDDVALGSPAVGFDTALILHMDDEEVIATALPAGHTDGDAIVYFKKSNVVHTGDAFVSINVPFHSGYGGKILGLADALRKIVELVPEDAKVIPGHGPVASIADIRDTIRVLDQVEAAVAQQVENGKTLAELKAMNLLNPWSDELGEELDWCLDNFYEALAGVAPAR